ncbi:DNA-directed RNA polymerase specialized sigma subunit, sigma24 [Arthrobacter sp. 9V]|uniref:RNA polymerase sigma factor n=1 Tax=Arthrobacter sp. 9V TaxID=2653132 RepID=UPI0012EF919A|nr:sigma-70 family RNA polymerase sigma factor [Arthrobacter sp. 9V]VXB79535.1 DNA-directed RNA polymerase specialized sigma subunit, sigma24 [Arthrobacter sp. 9V]
MTRTDLETMASSLNTEAAFEDCARVLTPALMAYFIRRVDPVDDATDCVSETLLVLWRQRERLPANVDEQRAWSFGVAKRVLANYRRGKFRRVALSEKLRACLVHQPAPGHQLGAEVHSALAALRPKDRELVMLIVWDGFGVAGAGALLGLSATAARTRYSRARKHLRATISS